VCNAHVVSMYHIVSVTIHDTGSPLVCNAHVVCTYHIVFASQSSLNSGLTGNQRRKPLSCTVIHFPRRCCCFSPVRCEHTGYGVSTTTHWGFEEVPRQASNKLQKPRKQFGMEQ